MVASGSTAENERAEDFTMRWFKTAATIAVMAPLAMASGAALAQEPSFGMIPGTGQVVDGKKAGDFMVRLRGLAIVPDDRAQIDTIGGNTKISNEYVPEIDFTYFATKNIAFELIAATARHNVKAVDTAAGNLNLGRVSHLPPTLLMQFHPAPDYFISPYLGAGINYTIFYDADAGPDINSINYDNSLGWALQAGSDIYLGDKFWLNFDIKYIRIQSDVEINHAIDAKVDVDPIIFGVGIGYKF